MLSHDNIGYQMVRFVIAAVTLTWIRPHGDHCDIFTNATVNLLMNTNLTCKSVTCWTRRRFRMVATSRARRP
jgi:hypothetical protein